jgi:hypothetical protein
MVGEPFAATSAESTNPGARASAASVERKPSRIRWYSTLESAAAGQATVLGIVETILAMTVYGWIALRQGTLHLTIAACVVPILLLRTPESTTLGIRWHARIKGHELSLSIALLLVLIAAAVSVTISLPTHSSVSESEAAWKAFYTHRSPVLLLFGFLFSATTGAMLFLVLPIIGLLLGLKAMATLASACSRPFHTICTIPQNWGKFILAIDMAHPPELIPGIFLHELSPATTLPLEERFSFANPFPLALSFIYQLFAHDWNRGRFRKNPLNWIVRGALIAWFALMGLVCALPAWLYRWSIKGTALFWFPLVFFAWDAPRTRPEYIKDSLAAKAAFAGSCAVSLVVLFAAVKRLIGVELPPLKWYSDLIAASASNPTAAAFFPADRTPAWQIFVAIGAGIIVSGFLFADRLKNRGTFTSIHKKIVETMYFALGLTSVAEIFSLIYAASTAIRR